MDKPDTTEATKDEVMDWYRRSIEESELWHKYTMPRRVFAELCEAIGPQSARTAATVIGFKVQGDCESNVSEASKNA